MPDSIATMTDQQHIERAVQRTVGKMARDVLAYFNGGAKPDLTPEQMEELKSTTAYRQLTELATVARQSGSGRYVETVLELAYEFYRASRMAARLLEHELNRLEFLDSHERAMGRAHLGKQKIAKAFRNETALYSLNLWISPTITSGEASIGSRWPLLTAPESNLRDVVAKYFRTGVRCPWFEKILLEALVTTKTFEMAQRVKEDADLTDGPTTWRRFMWKLIYHRTQGKSPLYEIAIGATSILTSLFALAAIAAVAWYSADALDGDYALWGYLGLLACGLVALNWVGRLVTRRVVGWATSEADFTPRGTARTLREMYSACRIVTDHQMSLHILRDTLLRCNANRVTFEQITQGLVERAINSGETMWFSGN